jgi:hypothetical protein
LAEEEKNTGEERIKDSSKKMARGRVSICMRLGALLIHHRKGIQGRVTCARNARLHRAPAALRCAFLAIRFWRSALRPRDHHHRVPAVSALSVGPPRRPPPTLPPRLACVTANSIDGGGLVV